VISAFTALGGFVIAIITLILAEYRRAKKTALQTEAVQKASALLGYQKLRVEVVKLVREKLSEEDAKRALDTLLQTDRSIEKASLAPDVAWTQIRKSIAIPPVVYSVGLVAVSLYELSTPEGTLVSSFAGSVVGLLMFCYFIRWIFDWSKLLKGPPAEPATASSGQKPSEPQQSD
jgi:hypothetical protein